jgi:hypothetical protein
MLYTKTVPLPTSPPRPVRYLPTRPAAARLFIRSELGSVWYLVLVGGSHTALGAAHHHDLFNLAQTYFMCDNCRQCCLPTCAVGAKLPMQWTTR